MKKRKKRGTICFITIIVLLCIFFDTSAVSSAKTTGNGCTTKKCLFAGKEGRTDVLPAITRSPSTVSIHRRHHSSMDPATFFPEFSPINNKEKKIDDVPHITAAEKIAFLEEIFFGAIDKAADSNVADFLRAGFKASREKIIYESCYTEELENKINDVNDVNAPEKAQEIAKTAKVLARNSYQEAFENFQGLKNPEEKTKEWDIFKRSLVKELKQDGIKEGYKKFETVGTGNFLRRLWACRAINPATNRALYTRENIDPSVEPQARNVLNMLAGLASEDEPNSPPSPPSESSEQQQEALNQPTTDKTEIGNVAEETKEK